MTTLYSFCIEFAKDDQIALKLGFADGAARHSLLRWIDGFARDNSRRES
jgi:hypothetical protein